MKKPHIECLLCKRSAGKQAKVVERHLHACFLGGPSTAPNAAAPAASTGGAGPAPSAASAAPPTGAAAGWAGRAAAAGDRVLVLELESEEAFRMIVLAAPHATFRHLRGFMLKMWLDCGCGHLSSFSRLAHPVAGPWPRHARARHQPSAAQLGAALRLAGEELGFTYDLGDSTSVIETAAALNAAAAAWLGSKPLAVALHNAHPGTVKTCSACGGPGRYLGDGTWCSKACAAAAGAEVACLRRWWNSPRMGACGYCGPDGLTPPSFWPAEPGFAATAEEEEEEEGGSGDEDSWDEGGEGEGQDNLSDGFGSLDAGSLDPLGGGGGDSYGGADASTDFGSEGGSDYASDDYGSEEGGEDFGSEDYGSDEDSGDYGSDEDGSGGGEGEPRAAPAAASTAAHAALVEPALHGEQQQQQHKRSTRDELGAPDGDQPPVQRQRRAEAAEGAAGGTASGGMAAPTATHLQGARGLLAPPTLPQLQAAAAAAAGVKQQL